MSGAARPSSSQPAEGAGDPSTHSIGYEPNMASPTPRQRTGAEYPWDKIRMGDLVDTLPKFDYEVSKRRRFLQALEAYFRGINAGWIMTNVWKEFREAGQRLQIADTRSGQAFTPARNILARGQAEQGDGQQAYLRSPVRDPGGGHALAQLSRRIGFAEPVPQAQSATGLGVQGFGQNPRSQ